MSLEQSIGLPSESEINFHHDLNSNFKAKNSREIILAHNR